MCVCVHEKEKYFFMQCDINGSSAFEELLRNLNDFRHNGVP